MKNNQTDLDVSTMIILNSKRNESKLQNNNQKSVNDCLRSLKRKDLLLKETKNEKLMVKEKNSIYIDRLKGMREKGK